MASQFAAHIHSARHQLVSDLVVKLVDVQPGEENHELASDYCLQNLYYHKFADVSPSAVTEFYEGLESRIHAESQLPKAAALQALRRRLVASDLKSQTLDLNYALLQLLASLSGRPLASQFRETPELLQLLYHAVPDASSKRTHAAYTHAYDIHPESDQDSYEQDIWAESSTLSDWDNDSQTADVDHGEASEADASPTQQQRLPADELLNHQTTDESLWRRPACSQFSAGSIPPVQEFLPQLAVPNSDDLLPALTAQRLHHLPFMHPNPPYCYQEAYVAEQALRVVQCQQSHCFMLDVESEQLLVDRRVHVPTLSPGALHRLLQEFADAGSKLRALLRLSRQLCQLVDGQGSTWESVRGYPMTPCLRAFGTALSVQLHSVSEQLMQLQLQCRGSTVSNSKATSSGQLIAADQNVSHVAKRGNWAALGAPEGVTLLAVRRLCNGVFARVQLLHGVCMPLVNELGGSAAQTTSALIDGLYTQLAGAKHSCSGPESSGTYGCLLHLLLCSLLPLVDSLGRWLFAGGDDEGPGGGDFELGGDFFISRGECVPVQDARFWSHAYVFTGTSISQQHAQSNSMANNDGNTEGNKDDAVGMLSRRTSSTSEALGEHMGEIAGSSRGFAGVSQLQCPSFLAPLARDILATGKSLRLLRHMQLEGLQNPRWNNRSGKVRAVKQHLGRSNHSARSMFSKDAVGRSESAASGKGLRRKWVTEGPGFISQGALSSGMAAQADVSTSHIHSMPGPDQTIDFITCSTRLRLAVAVATASQRDEASLEDQFLGNACYLLRRDTVGGIAGVKQQVQGLPANVGEAMGLAGTLVGHPCDLISHAKSYQAHRVPVTELMKRVDNSTPATSAATSAVTPAATSGTSAGEVQGTTMLQAADAASKMPSSSNSSSSSSSTTNSTSRMASTAAVAGNTQEAAHHTTPAQATVSKDAAAEEPVSDNTEHQTAAAAAAVASAEGASSDPAAAVAAAVAEPSSTLSFTSWHENLQKGFTAVGVRLQRLMVPPNAEASNGCSSSSYSRGLDLLWPLHGRAPGQATAKWQQPCSLPQQQLQWLLHEHPAELLPVQCLMEHALLAPIKDRVEVVGAHLLGAMMTEWGLLQELTALRNLYLTSSAGMVAWADGVLMLMEERGGLEQLEQAELECMLQELIISASPDESLPEPTSLSVTLDKTALIAAKNQRLLHQASTSAGMAVASRGSSYSCLTLASVLDLGCLAVRHGSSWLLSLVADPNELQLYNKALVFLLQLRWVRRTLDNALQDLFKTRASLAQMARQDSVERNGAAAAASLPQTAGAQFGVNPSAHVATAATAGRQPLLTMHQELLLLHEMCHLMTNLHKYVMDRLMHGAWVQFEQALQSAQSLDEIRAHHVTFQQAVLRQCCQGSSKGRGSTWRHIGKSLLQLMDVVLRFCGLHSQLMALRNSAGQLAAHQLPSLWLQIAQLRQQLATAAASWHDGQSYLLRILRNKALQLGGDDELETLLGAINFNQYYKDT